MNIEYTRGGLAHAYKKHHITKSRIRRELEKGVKAIVTDDINNSLIIFTENLLAIAVDKDHNLKTAFKTSEKYFLSKCRLGKIVEDK